MTPVGGIDKLPTFVALLGSSDLKLAVLMDGAVRCWGAYGAGQLGAGHLSFVRW